jgi:ATP-dependent exoDNAse (exonuclease V) beta subunit
METLCNNDNQKGEVDFETACDDGMQEDDSALMDLVRRAMRRNALANRKKKDDSTEKTLVRMVRNALDTEITIGRMSFKLKDIPRKNRMAEVEFVADENSLLNLPIKREGVLNGKIDLLIRVGDKVVILDWKTNSLSDYTDSAVIEAAMNEADYHLQYQLYSMAVDAWLKSWGVELAGAAYLFVRGGEVGQKSALFVREFDAQCVERFRNDISQKGFFADSKEAE